MGFSVIILAISCVGVLQAAALGDLKDANRQPTGAIQITRSTIGGNSNVKKMQDRLRAAHINLQSNQIAEAITRNQEHANQPQNQQKHHLQDTQTTTYSEQFNKKDQSFQTTESDFLPTTTISSVLSGNTAINDEISHFNNQQMNRQMRSNLESQEKYNSKDHSAGQQQFFDNKQQNSRDQQYYNSRQQSPAEQQQFFSPRQQSQQQAFPARQNSPSQQQFYNIGHQSESHQQQFDNQRVQQDPLFTARQQSNLQQQQFFNSGKQSQDQQLFNARQQSVGQQQPNFNARQNFPEQQQQFNNDRQNFPEHQQQFNNARQNFPEQQQQFNNARQNFPEQQQQFNNAGQQSYEQQQQFFNAGQQQNLNNNLQTMDIDGQNINLNNQFQGLSIHQSQIRSDRPLILSQDTLTQMHSKGVRKDVQPSAFDNREHGLTLPRGSSAQSSSVVVSGLKNLPVLPALVYNAGPVPASHGVAIGRDGLYKGSASLNQQMRTPYVRYVYSHIL